MYISILFCTLHACIAQFSACFREIDFNTELLDFSPSKYITLNLSSQTNVILYSVHYIYKNINVYAT